MVETRSQHAGRITQRNATIVVNTNVNNEPIIRASTLGNQNQSSLKQHVMTGILPGRKAVCFYCGRRSAQRLKTTAREWECEKCLAVNYLDENGDIADPPVTVTAPTVRYAMPVSRADSPKRAAMEDPLFCATCLKNQHLLAETLASYLPSIDHPEYHDYEAAYPAYRDGLESRYPQVCEDCEPRVRERIRAAGYFAKTEGMKKMLERTRMRNAQGVRTTSIWLQILVTLGSLMWWTSVAGQLMWSLVSIVMLQRECDSASSRNGVEFLACTAQPHLVAFAAFLSPSDLARYSLLFGILSIWYHRYMMYQVDGYGSAGQVVGRGEYYQIQVLALSVRIGVWWLVRDSDDRSLEPNLHRGLQLFLLVFTLISTTISRRLIRISWSPKISLQEEIKPLRAGPAMSKSHRVIEPFYNPPPSREAPQDGLSDADIRRYEHLASTSALPRPLEPLGRPPTPPDSLGDDAMDWTPTRAFEIPPPQALVVEQVRPVPSFSGFSRLPPAPRGPAARLRNPIATIPYFKSAQTKRESFFQANTPIIGADCHQDQRNFELAPPKFFPRVSRQSETGLEGIFDNIFKLDEEPIEIAHLRERSRGPVAMTTHDWRIWASRTISVGFLIVALVTWRYPVHNQETYRLIRLAVIGACTLIITINIMGAIRGTISGMTNNGVSRGFMARSSHTPSIQSTNESPLQLGTSRSPPRSRRRSRDSLRSSDAMSELSLGVMSEDSLF